VNIFRKIEEILFYFLLFAIPFQARKILWQQNWYFNEWQAISLYQGFLARNPLFILACENLFKKTAHPPPVDCVSS